MNEEQNRIFEQKRQSDSLKYEHCIIENIFACLDEKKQEPGRIEIFGYSYDITTFTNKGGISYQSKGTTTKHTLVIRDKDATHYNLRFNDTLIRLTEKQILTLFHYIKRTCKPNCETENMIRFVREQAEGYCDTYQNIVQTFIKKLDSKLLLLPRIINQVDAFLVFKNNDLEYIVQTDILQQAAYVSYEIKEPNKGETSITINLQDEDICLNYLRTMLFPFSQVVSEDINADEKVGIAVAYYCIEKMKISEFASNFQRNILINREISRNSSKEEAIESYLNLEDISHDDSVVFGCFVCFLMCNCMCFNPDSSYVDNYQEMVEEFFKQQEQKKKNSFRNSLVTDKAPQSNPQYSIDDVDIMNGIEFENFVAQIFKKLGYIAEVTKATGDQGIDIIAERNGIKIGIQAKCYTGTVGNSAIQEVVGGKELYHTDKVMVVTNRFYSQSAETLASANGVILWDRNILKEKIQELNKINIR